MTISRACWVAVALITMAGCRGEMRDVMSLANTGDAQPPDQVTTVTKKGWYYLFSSKSPDSHKYRFELRPGDQLGFRVRGNRVEAFAKGAMVELDEYSDGASYTWKYEEKRE